MEKRHKRSVTIKGQTNKSSIHSHAQRSRRHLKSIPHQHTINPYTSNTQSSYLLRKRAQQRLRAISNGNIRLVTDQRFPQLYSGHHARHYLVDIETEHIFKASLREVALTGADRINPFTNYPIDLDHYGSLGAIQEHVHGLTFGNIEFTEDNELGEVGDLYEFMCGIHRYRFKTPFSAFLADPMGACATCQFSK